MGFPFHFTQTTLQPGPPSPFSASRRRASASCTRRPELVEGHGCFSIRQPPVMDRLQQAERGGGDRWAGPVGLGGEPSSRIARAGPITLVYRSPAPSPIGPRWRRSGPGSSWLLRRLKRTKQGAPATRRQPRTRPIRVTLKEVAHGWDRCRTMHHNINVQSLKS